MSSPNPEDLARYRGHRWPVNACLWNDGDWWHLASRSAPEMTGMVTSFSAPAPLERGYDFVVRNGRLFFDADNNVGAWSGAVEWNADIYAWTLRFGPGVSPANFALFIDRHALHERLAVMQRDVDRLADLANELMDGPQC